MDTQYIIDTIINNFNLGLIIAINAFTYILITICNNIFKNKVPKQFKIIFTIISIIIFGFIYWKIGNLSIEVIISSCISAPLIWDWIIKPIFKKVKLDYETK